MSDTAELKLPEQTLELPVVVGTENEHAVDITALRGQSGYITLDSGYGNTGSCKSDITYIDGEKGILRYRGYAIEDLAENSNFLETAYLLIWGELPSAEEYAHFEAEIKEHSILHEQMRKIFEGLPPGGHPMATLSAMINATSCYHETLMQLTDEEGFRAATVRLLAKTATIAAFSYKHAIGRPLRYPDDKLDYSSNFLHMMFSLPHKRYDVDPEVARALDQIFILHADHEQNCSTSTVRMVGSSKANLFASCAAGVCALWGPLHGGANAAVLAMLEKIHAGEKTVKDFMEGVKNKEERLMGFGHRVYKNFDPRAKILGEAADVVLPKLGINDPLLDIAKELEQIALADDYFVERKLYPNVDFYSGILMRGIGIPVNMFTVLFSIGRMPGWIAHYREVMLDPKARINRPRQVYTGPNERKWAPADQR
ncbi:MAG: citrate synthase [Planctomycetota bacterium]|jgi:citrate synthase